MGILEEWNHFGDIVLWGKREYGGKNGNAKKGIWQERKGIWEEKEVWEINKGMWNM